MANIMELKSISNNTSRSGFDIGNKNAFTAKVGELLPVYCKEVLPGDSFEINLQSMTRTMPINTAAYVRIREYYDYFFVPYRLLWRYANAFFTQMPNVESADSIDGPTLSAEQLPSFSYFDYLKNFAFGNQKNIVGLNRASASRKLMNYLGYGNPQAETYPDIETFQNYYGYDVPCNPLKLLAYQKIYNDYYRFQQWEQCNPSTFNMDYLTSGDIMLVSDYVTDYNSDNPSLYYDESLFDLRYSNWNKDLLMGVLPRPQFGDTSMASPITGNFKADLDFEEFDPTGTNRVTINTFSDGYENKLGLSVIALRQAEFLQKWKEIAQSADQNYKDQIEKHFGVKVPNIMSNMCQWIGGCDSTIDIGAVLNNNLTGDEQATIHGIGTGVNKKHIKWKNKTQDYGVIMCIYHAQPLLDYDSNRLDFLNTKLRPTDFAIPEMDKVGMEQLSMRHIYYGKDLYGNTASYDWSQEILGYVPRYIDYKTSVDEVHGAFLSTLKSWVAPIQNILADLIANNTAVGRGVTYKTFKVNPSIMDSIMNLADDSVDSDQLLVNSYHDVSVVRNLDYNGLPY